MIETGLTERVLKFVDGDDPPQSEPARLLLDDGEPPVVSSRSADAHELASQRADRALPVASDHVRGRVGLRTEVTDQSVSRLLRTADNDPCTHCVAHLERAPQTGERQGRSKSAGKATVSL